MDIEFKNQINKTDIPKLLKDYFLRNIHVHLYLNESLLREIEEIHIEYDSLYEFDQAEFCSYIITGIKKQDKHEYFYHYLRKVLDSNLNLIPKSQISDYQKLTKLGKNLSNLQESEIPKIMMDLVVFIDEFKATNNFSKLFLAHKLTGILEVLFVLNPESLYKNDFKYICNKLVNLDIKS